jgi:hypothetical protein
MANVDAKFGARLVGHLYGSPFTARVRSYTVPASDGTALFVGDFVKITGTASAGSDGIVRQEVIQAAATNTLVGIVIGFSFDTSYQNQIYRTLSTLRTAYVCDDPNALFEIQSDGVVDAGDIGSNADIVVAAGSTVTGISGMELEESSVTAATAQLRILDLAPRADNAVGANGNLICMINEHQYKTTSGV